MELSSLESKHLAIFEEGRSPNDLIDPDMNHFEDVYRRDSFIHQNDNSILSPAESQGQLWDRITSAYSADPVSAAAPHDFHQNGHTFMASDAQHHAFVAQHHPQHWPLEQHPMPSASHSHFVQPHYAGSHYVSYPHPPSGMQYPVVPDQPAMAPWSPDVQSPLSPQQTVGGVVVNVVARKGKAGAKKDDQDGPGSPRQSVLAPDQSGGIRKKNNKIDIPMDRTLTNIDRLIAEAQDEVLKKELKSQKRLLRNRDAALTSREKKRQQMKELEEDKVKHLERLDEMDETVQTQSEEIMMLTQQLRDAHQVIQDLRQEQVKHKEEAISLRLRLRRFMDNVAMPMSVSTSSSGYSDLGMRMGAMNVNQPEAETEWEEFIQGRLSDETGEDFMFNHDHDRAGHTPMPERQEATTAAAAAAARSIPHESEGNRESAGVKSLVQLLVLCGAFIASSPSATQSGDLLNVPPVVRAAAPAVLDHFLTDKHPSGMDEASHTIAASHQPMLPTGIPNGDRMQHIAGAIATTSRQNDLDQAFGLTPAEFASISSADYAMQGPVAGRDNGAPPKLPLAQRLAELNLDKPRSRVDFEVSTRSLLWEQIPPDVVRQFKAMVRDRDELEARQRRHVSPFLAGLDVKPEP